MVGPFKIFFYYIALLFFLLVLSILLHKGHISVGGIGMRWISIHEVFPFFYGDDSCGDLDSVIVGDSFSIPEVEDSIQLQRAKDSKISHFQYKYPFALKLEVFFKKMRSANRNTQPLRILHIGDSQLEGDRITKFLRVHMQRRFGGSGPGFVQVYDPLKQNPSIWLTNSGDWSLKRVYQARDRFIGTRYGMGCTVASYDIANSASFKISSSPLAEKGAESFYRIELLLDRLQDSVGVKSFVDGQLFRSESVFSTGLESLKWSLDYIPASFKVVFDSKQKFSVLGCLFDSIGGVALDNIALRGQMTPRLERNDIVLMKEMFRRLNIGAVILQFGTNVVPTVVESYRFYQTELEKQLSMLEEIAPEIPVFVIGVGDAGTLVHGEPKSFDHIELISRSMEEAALNKGCAFYNLFSRMGGEGSMIKWVGQRPPRGMTDYLHFTQTGGKTVAGWLFEDLEKEYVYWETNNLDK